MEFAEWRLDEYCNPQFWMKMESQYKFSFFENFGHSQFWSTKQFFENFYKENADEWDLDVKLAGISGRKSAQIYKNINTSCIFLAILCIREYTTQCSRQQKL